MPITATITVPETAHKGEIVPIRAQICQNGEQDSVVRHFVCRYNGVALFKADWHFGQADPLVVFQAEAAESGTLDFIWTDDAGRDYRTETRITIM